MDLNKIMVIGRLTRDPEKKADNAPVTFSVATNYSYKKKDSDEKVDQVTYHEFIVWGKLGDICLQYLTKGKQIYAEGRVQTQKWQTKEGENRYKNVNVLNEMVMLGSKDGGSGESSARPVESGQTISDQVRSGGAAPKQDADGDDIINIDDIPF